MSTARNEAFAPIQKVAIYGAGNIGAYLIWGLQEKLGDNLSVVAEGERRERLLREGLEINGEHYDLHVQTPEEARGADVVFVAVKYGGLQGILPGVRLLAGDGQRGNSGETPTVMSLMNGVDSDEILAEVVDWEQLVPSIIRISAQRIDSHVTIHPVAPGMGILFGDRGRQNEKNPRVQALAALFADTPLEYTVHEHILAAMWHKFGVSNSENMPQAVIDVGLGAYVDSEHMAWIRRKIWEETRAVAAAQGIPMIEEPDPETVASFPKSAKYSTLQDILAKRPTEADMFGGTLTRLGKKYGVPTPVTTAVYHLLKAVEEKNAGKFDWE